MAEVHRLSTLLFTAILLFVVIMADNRDTQDLKITSFDRGNLTVMEDTIRRQDKQIHSCEDALLCQMNLNEEQEKTVVTLTSRIDSCEKKLAQQRIKGALCLDKSKDCIAFSVYLKADIHDAFNLDRMIFDGIVLNNGNGYNSSTGTFTCSIPGTYVFYYTLAVTKGSQMSTAIWYNGKDVNWNEAFGTEKTDGTGSSSVILDLQPGDMVRVKKYSFLAESKVKAKYSTFGGHKI